VFEGYQGYPECVFRTFVIQRLHSHSRAMRAALTLRMIVVEPFFCH
jgi:hypothetical protein